LAAIENAADVVLLSQSESDQSIFLKPAPKKCQKVQFFVVNIISVILML
jgi:hypothetical protein